MKGITAEAVPERFTKGKTPEAAAAAVAAYVDRFRIVGTTADGTGLIREEVTARILKTLSPGARRVVGALLAKGDPALIREVLGAFDARGELKTPKGWTLG